MPRHPKPTAAELQILVVLWRRGPSTVNQVQPELLHGDRVGYTTILKLLQIMNAKGPGAPRRERRGRTSFAPRSGKRRCERRFVTDLLDQVFEGSATSLAMHALSIERTTAKSSASCAS